MNPHATASASPVGAVRSLWANRQLIARMGQREIIGRYKGSAMGLAWSFITPLFMLAIYTFVFSVVFQARWGTSEESKTQFAVVLFAGLIVHTLFSDVINRAPQLVLGNVNYVKKVVFPLEILPVVSCCPPRSMRWSVWWCSSRPSWFFKAACLLPHCCCPWFCYRFCC